MTHFLDIECLDTEDSYKYHVSIFLQSVQNSRVQLWSLGRTMMSDNFTHIVLLCRFYILMQAKQIRKEPVIHNFFYSQSILVANVLIY